MVASAGAVQDTTTPFPDTAAVTAATGVGGDGKTTALEDGLAVKEKPKLL